ncbi:MAG: hypothetical protein V9F03_16745 [Microthrixaceae bacterium]
MSERAVACGVFRRGYCLMVGGNDAAVRSAAPILDVISPDFDSVERTVGRTGEPIDAEQGWLHCGPNGAGHFVKMVHNGIEYGIMAAYAEGLNLFTKADAYGFDIDEAKVAELWRRGSVVGSWLLDLTASAFAKSPDLAEFEGVVSDNGEGRWTLEAGVDLAVPMPVLAGALFSRFSSAIRIIGRIRFSPPCETSSVVTSSPRARPSDRADDLAGDRARRRSGSVRHNRRPGVQEDPARPLPTRGRRSP